MEVVFLSARIDSGNAYNERAEGKPHSQPLEVPESFETASPHRRHNGGRLAFVVMVQEKFPGRRRRRFSSGYGADIFEMVSRNFMLRSIGCYIGHLSQLRYKLPRHATKFFG